jgi:hypothetical protein
MPNWDDHITEAGLAAGYRPYLGGAMWQAMAGSDERSWLRVR